MHDSLRILLIAVPSDTVDGGVPASPFGPFSITVVADVEAAVVACSAKAFDAIVVDVDRLADAHAGLRGLGANSACLVVCNSLDPASMVGWLAQGAEDVIGRDEVASPELARRVRAAIERKRVESDSRKAYATDLATGLPHQQQLVEHMSQLLALREREPAPMAVLLLRIEGFATTEARLGPEAADALRRKIAVRLRAAVRASDVVAAIDADSFGVLLGSLLAPADADRVGAKLARSLMEPFSVGGASVAVAVALGVAQYPADGTQPETLLRKAIGMALDEPAQGRIGMANFEETAARLGSAANDE